MAIVLVQHKDRNISGGGNITLDATPTVGNYLVLWLAERDSDGDPVTPAGFTAVASAVSTSTTAFVNRWGKMFYRVVVSGDDATYSTQGWTSCMASLSEWSGIDSVFDVASASNLAAASTQTISITAPGDGRDVVLIGAFVVGATSGGSGGNGLPTMTPTASVTELHDMRNNNNASPRSWLGYRIFTAASGSKTVSATQDDASSHVYGRMAVMLAGALPGVAPVADFSANAASILEGGSVDFTDLSTNTPTSWAWDFGDGGTSTSQNPTHVFAAAGTYTVSLTATNASGSDTETKTGYIHVNADLGDFEEPPPANAIVEIYASHVGDARWDQANWDEAVWGTAGWQDVTPQSVEAKILWGSSEPELGILSRPSAGSWSIDTYDPERLMDPANEDSPYFGDLEPGLPIRISHRGIVVRQGIVESMSYGFADDRGFIRVQDNIAPLANAKVPSDVDLGDTLYARARAAIAAAGLSITVLPDPATGDPALVPWVTGTDRSAWQWIQDAAESVLHIPYIDRIGRLGFRPWATPLSRARDLTATELIDLTSLVQYDGLYSVVNALDDDGVTVVERASTPPPRYGARTYSRNSATPNVDDWLDAVLADRVRSGRRWLPGQVYPLTAASVEKYATIEAVELLSLSNLFTDPVVAQDVIVVGGSILIFSKDNDEAQWRFEFQAAETVQSPLITEDGAGFVVSEDGSVFLYPE